MTNTPKRNAFGIVPVDVIRAALYFRKNTLPFPWCETDLLFVGLGVWPDA